MFLFFFYNYSYINIYILLSTILSIEDVLPHELLFIVYLHYIYIHIPRLIRAFESFFHDHRGSNSWALEAGGLTMSDSAVPSRLGTV